MCGICGFVNLDGSPADRGIVESMNKALTHRGPDGLGVFIDGPVILAMRRLAIIDLEGGRQPMSNEDGNVRIVFNGEIYNSPKLRQQLQNLGHHFVTRSDTETIVHQYEESGTRCTDYLRGMFAFAILDQRPQTNGGSPVLFLARDRVGIKPVFYYSDSHLFAFSSELTSLVQHPGIPRGIDHASLHRYLSTGAVAAPLTMFKNIRQLLPGHHLVLEGSRLSVQKYWQLPSKSFDRPLSRQDAVTQLRTLLEQVVEEHLLSDVPVGAFLSGGIDSSTVVALMAMAKGHRVSTFSIRFEEEGFDESPFSNLVATRYGTDHHEFTVPNQSFDIDLLQTVITHHGQPTADSSAIPTFIVSRFAREYVKVVLSGDGGDECFAGYSHFGWAQQIDHLYNYPYMFRQLITRVLRIAATLPGLGQEDRLRQAINAADASLSDRAFLPIEVLRINSDSEINYLLVPDWRIEDSPPIDELHDFLRENYLMDPIERSQRFAYRYYLPDAYLSKVDRMSMANALEVRVPLLDHHLVEFCLSLPGHMHWRDGTGKQLLREAVIDLLPEEIFKHQKQGFSIPLHQWTTSAYFELAEELLGESEVRRRGLFNPMAVRNLLDRCQGRQPHHRSFESNYRLSHKLFMLVNFELWCRFYLDDLIAQPTETARWIAYESE